MSVLEEVLLEEYDRSMRIKAAIEKEQESLPKGSIQKKLIHGVECYYLQFRENDKVKSKYINANDLDAYKENISKRKENAARLKELKQSIKQIEKALGKDVINEYSANRVY